MNKSERKKSSRSQTFGSNDRVKRQVDFERVYQRDVFAADEVLVLKGCENGGSRTRLGLSVSRKVGSAVLRNRWKRVIREAFRRVKQDLPPGLDLVARPRKGADPDYHLILRSLPQLVRRIQRKLEQSPTSRDAPNSPKARSHPARRGRGAS